MFRQSLRELISKDVALERKAYVSESNDWLASTSAPTANGRREILLTLATVDCASMSEDSTGWSIESYDGFIRSDCMIYNIMKKLFFGVNFKEKTTAV